MSVAIVVIKRTASVSGYIEVFESVVIVVANRDPGGIAESGKARMLRDIFEGSIRFLVIEPVPVLRSVFLGNRALRSRIVEPRAIGEKDIQAAIVIVIEQGHARSHRLQKVFLVGWRSLLPEVNAKFFRDIDKMPRQRRALGVGDCASF